MPNQTTSQDAISLHLRTYRSALKSTHEITIKSLETTHINMHSTLHPHAGNPEQIDVPALAYALLRLPEITDNVDKVILGQNQSLFLNIQEDPNSWQPVSAPARRRRIYHNPINHSLCCFIGSISDIDDITTTLTAYQIEWNKLHFLLQQKTIDQILPASELQNLYKALGSNYQARLDLIKTKVQSLRLRLLASSWVDYAKTTQSWWKHLAKTVSDTLHISHQTIYFVSSNSHSLLNLITTVPLKEEIQISKYLEVEKPNLYNLYQKIKSKEHSLPLPDFLYYASKFLPKDRLFNLQQQEESRLGIIQVDSPEQLFLTTQLISVKSLSKANLDPELKIKNPTQLANSNALIFNIQYPLGFLAYHILNETLENVARIKGVYVMGKAAVLNGQLGDIQVPRLVFDEHTQNSYLFHNCFNHDFPFVNNQGSILTNQKAVTVLGTFLQNPELLEQYSENNLTVLEMESGPYLSAIAEATYQERLPQNTIVDLNQAPFDIGIINYTSDNPYSQNSNLGAQPSLDLAGVEPTYLASRAILQRILDLEQSTI